MSTRAPCFDGKERKGAADMLYPDADFSARDTLLLPIITIDSTHNKVAA